MFSGSSASAMAAANEKHTGNSQLRTGNGEWTYDIVPDWGALPIGETFGANGGSPPPYLGPTVLYILPMDMVTRASSNSMPGANIRQVSLEKGQKMEDATVAMG
jgi:hypothetical protein